MTKSRQAEQCTATSRRSGRRCGRLVIGGGVCIMHGGRAPQVKAKRLERVAIAEQMASSPRRHPGEVLLDAVHTSDVLALNARGKLEGGQAVTVREMRELVDATLRAATLARSALSANAESISAQASVAQAEQVARALSHFMRSVGLARDPDAERALAEAVRFVTPGEESPLVSGQRSRELELSAEQGAAVAQVIRQLVLALGLDVDSEPWVSELVRSMLRGFREDGEAWTSPPPEPPRAWWHQIAARAARELGIADPTAEPRVEVLPALPSNEPVAPTAKAPPEDPPAAPVVPSVPRPSSLVELMQADNKRSFREALGQ